MAASAKDSGRYVACPGGYRAFLPAPLPPKLAWEPALVGLLSRADRAIGRLAGGGVHLPNPHLLIRPFIRREAVLSSKIEGTQATLGELLAREAGSAVERSPDDLREVANYVAALEHGIKRLATLPLSLRLIRELHARLMRGVRGEHATPGEFRRTQNWIGPAGSTPSNATFIPPPPHELLGCLGALEKFLRSDDLPPLVQIALAHWQFEAIHPFLDGNGRIGRLLVTLFLVERGVLPTPLLYLSAYLDATRTEYYARLRAVSERSAWPEWIAYLLRGVAEQAEDAVERAERIHALLQGWRAKAARMRARAPSLFVDLLTENPFWSTKRLAQRLGVAFTTAQRAVLAFEKAGILTQVNDAARDRMYCAKALLEVFESPTFAPRQFARRMLTRP